MTDDLLEILLVEDNPAEADLVREALSGGPFRLEVIENGVQALEALRCGASRPELLLLDLNLPGLDGAAILRAVKQDAGLRSLPVVILTSCRAAERIRECYENYANCYVVKPAGLDEFFGAVRAVAEFWRTVAERPPQRGVR